MYCIQLFFYLFICFFAFMFYMCIILFALFSTMILHITSSIFVVKLFTFTHYVFYKFSRCHFLVFLIFLTSQIASFCDQGLQRLLIWQEHLVCDVTDLLIYYHSCLLLIFFDHYVLYMYTVLQNLACTFKTDFNLFVSNFLNPVI